jgi:cation diffusion facilitator CzcD-associated flavoprotein CzcO
MREGSTRILIIGSGFSGLAMAVKLRARGIEDFVILERGAEIGGTWRDNQYPGCACDVRSALYSFSFAPNPDWSRQFAPQEEIWSYLRDCVRRFDLRRHIALEQDVQSATWDGARNRWIVTTRTHRWQAEVLVAATGPLSEPAEPTIPGLEQFAGKRFHSARWNHRVELTNKRVAVIGTGASAVQFVPHVQRRTAQVDVYQRTPTWILPRHDREVPSWRRKLYRDIPETQRLVRAGLFWLHEALFTPFRHPRAGRIAERVARWHLYRQVRDRTMRAQLTPSFAVGCKRVIFSDDYYPALTQPNVSLITDRIAEVRPEGIVAADGTLREADVLILGTGFRATDPPIAYRITGRDGRTLATHWAGSPRAYMSTTVAGFPNLFLLLGPNAGLGHSSVVLVAEAQVEHVMGVLDLMRARGAAAVEPAAEAQERFVRWVDAENATTVWNSGGCNSWYLDATGRNATLWPHSVVRFQRMVGTVRAADYQ